ncbi:MAG TPA: hypothetical protein VF765_29575 [Polyangiaceae bacterium]
MSTQSAPPAPPGGDTDEGPAKPAPLQLELPAASAVPATAQTEPERRERRVGASGRRVATRLVLVLLALVVAGAAAAAYWLPRWVRRQFIEAAAAHGITLTIEDARIDQGGFRLLGLHATAEDLPGASASAPEVDVETSGLRPTRLTVRGADVEVSGAWSPAENALAKWRASPRGGQGGDFIPPSIVVEDSRIVWKGAVGDAGRVEAAGLHLDVTEHDNGTELHARSDNVSLGVPGGALGPWRVDVDRTPGMSRVRVALDPQVPDTSTVLVVGDGSTTQVDVTVPRTPPSRIGIPPQLFGVRGSDLQVEANVHYTNLGPAHAEATARGAVHAIEVTGLPKPIEVVWDGTATGDASQGMDVKRARLAVGPLLGTVTGTLRTFDEGFRVVLAWSAGPVPCNAFDTQIDEGTPFDIAYQLRKLAEATGLTKLSGEVSARGSATIDSRDVGATHVEFVPVSTCQVALFAP